MRKKAIVCTYTIVKALKTTRHYKCTSGNTSVTPLTELINISTDRGFAKSAPTYWLSIRENNKWQKPRFTGLFKTSENSIYKGDHKQSKTIILFEFTNNAYELKIHYLKGFLIDEVSNYFKTHFNNKKDGV